MLRFWSVINCIFVHWTKKLTLKTCALVTQKWSQITLTNEHKNGLLFSMPFFSQWDPKNVIFSIDLKKNISMPISDCFQTQIIGCKTRQNFLWSTTMNKTRHEQFVIGLLPGCCHWYNQQESVTWDIDWKAGILDQIQFKEDFHIRYPAEVKRKKK